MRQIDGSGRADDYGDARWDMSALEHYRQAQEYLSLASHFTRHPSDNAAELVNPEVQAHLAAMAGVHARLAEVGAQVLVAAGHSRELAALREVVSGG